MTRLQALNKDAVGRGDTDVRAFTSQGHSLNLSEQDVEAELEVCAGTDLPWCGPFCPLSG